MPNFYRDRATKILYPYVRMAQFDIERFEPLNLTPDQMTIRDGHDQLADGLTTDGNGRVLEMEPAPASALAGRKRGKKPAKPAEEFVGPPAPPPLASVDKGSFTFLDDAPAGDTGTGLG